ncbi:hypothetical protein [Nocardia aurea]|uniref:Uncharacterized protein n=1 Tax=Nocardia aurea TaxID=2144174 RepID=A0ABV3G5B6_9NOCA
MITPVDFIAHDVRGPDIIRLLRSEIGFARDPDPRHPAPGSVRADWVDGLEDATAALSSSDPEMIACGHDLDSWQLW